MKKFFLFFFTALLLTSQMVSCIDDDPENEQELITKVTFTLTPDVSGTPVVLQFVDSDGDGGNPPVITTSGPLKNSTLYHGEILVSNEAAMPPVDITTEIKEESDDHQFFFIPSGDLDGKISFQYADIDNNGNPVGLLTDVHTHQTSSGGKLKIVLRHEPNKTASGVNQGNIANAGGETDIEIEFNVNIE